jgi:hypothetical protein
MGREPPAPIWAEDSLRARSCLARKPRRYALVMLVMSGIGGEGREECTLVVDLTCGFDQVLEVSAGEEVAEVDEFAVALVFDVDGAPSVLACGDGAAGL